jgi:type IV secretion system protein VirB6
MDAAADGTVVSLAACAPVSSGFGFLKSSLAYLDCAGRTIGSSGYNALVHPGSVIAQLILTAVTLFIAWHGIRMMFGRMPDMGDAVLAVAKIGLALMLVTSWPAVRTLIADPSLAGPAELVAQTNIAGPLALEDRLQRVDDGIVALTSWGTGKLDIRAGRTADGQPAASAFTGIALADNLAFGIGRLCFLIGSLMSFGLLRLLVGVMISALPIFAGLLLFDSSRGLFLGWLRMMFALFVASFTIPLILTVELSLLEPWLARAIEQRSAFYATPSAPTELWAISGSFLLILIGSTALVVKMCFSVDFSKVAGRFEQWRQAPLALQPAHNSISLQPAITQRLGAPSRAESLAQSIGRNDQPPKKLPMLGAALHGRHVHNDGVTIDAGRGRTSANRQRAKQRMALSHVKRNQS